MSEMFEDKIKNTAKPEQKEEDICRRKVLASLERADFGEQLQDEIVNRLTLMEKDSKFNEDSRQIERGMENILNLLEDRYGEQYPQLRLSEKQRANGRMAVILHDIGKSGPAKATPEEQEIIIKFFACENIKNPNLLVVDLIAEIFGASQTEKINHSLENCGIHAQTTMRQFWDQHAHWTRDILESYPQGLDKHTKIIACSHHIDHGINPYSLPESEVPLVANVIGTLEEYVEALEERALIALDQYEASVRRGGLSHEDALSRVRKNLVKFRKDELMDFVLDAIDELGKKQAIFN
jgi:hypothetical protein